MISYEQFYKELSEASRDERVFYFERDFFAWWLYYFLDDFTHPLADFHFDWIRTLEKTHKNILIKGFRGSIKTTMIVAWLTYGICYKKFKFLIWQSFGSASSARMTKQIAMNLLFNKKLQADYGELYTLKGSREEMESKSIGDFDTKNGIKVMSASLGEKIRGAISRKNRPDMLVLDDIDVSDSVRNPEIIQKNYDKITGETIGALNKEYARIIFLGNVITNDGIVPRFENEKKNDKNWEIFVQPLYNADGSVAWDYFTNEMIEKIKSNEGSGFKPNYLLEPITE